MALLICIPIPFFCYFWWQTFEIWRYGERYQGLVVKVERRQRGKNLRWRTEVKWPNGETKTYTLRSRHQPG